MTPEELLEAHGIEGIASSLERFIQRQRWFGGRGRSVTSLRFEDAALLQGGDPALLLLATTLVQGDGRVETYSLPLAVTAARAPEVAAAAVIESRGGLLVHDALARGEWGARLWQLVASGGEVRTCRGHLRFVSSGSGGAEALPEDVHPLGGEQSNSALVWADLEFMKLLRRLEPGPSIELEMMDALVSGGFERMARPLGNVHLVRPGAADTPVALVQTFLRGVSDGWQLALESLEPAAGDGGLDTERRQDPADPLRLGTGSFREESTSLGQVVAAMHRALASPRLAASVRPQPLSVELLGSWADEMDGQLDQLLAEDHPALDPLRPRAPAIRARFGAIRSLAPSGLATRVHGDLHLGQLLRTSAGWMVLDFEGEPQRPPEQRRRRYSPLRDVAGMLRSFDYAPPAALASRLSPEDPRWAEAARPGRRWSAANRRAFWESYLQGAGGGRLLPPTEDALTLLRAFELDKAVYEVRYELGHRGAGWAAIPLAFLLEVGGADVESR